MTAEEIEQIVDAILSLHRDIMTETTLTIGESIRLARDLYQRDHPEIDLDA